MVVSLSAHRLNLRLLCTLTTLTREVLVSWPNLPIIIRGNLDLIFNRIRSRRSEFVENIVDALKHKDRICEIYLRCKANQASLRLTKIAEAALEPFPMLTRLELSLRDGMAVVLPDTFMGGSTPRLQRLDLFHVSFPTLPNLLLSATDLNYLRLWDIPNSGYISPGGFVTCLPAMTRLETFHLGFRFPRPPPDQRSRHPPQLTRIILPALTRFLFRGNSEYLDDLMAQIDVPLLDELNVTFFNQLVFDIPQLLQLVSRTRLNALNQADILIDGDYVRVKFSPQRGTASHKSLMLMIKCRNVDWQISSLAQVFRPSLPPLSTLERLDILEGLQSLPRWQDGMENIQWLDLLQPFTAVKNLYLSKELVSRVAPALQELIGDGAVELLPALQNLFIEGPHPTGPVQEAIAKFILERQLSGHPATVHHW
jgi:hypothetical protein